eukprot:3845771-Amphidinium_carterae.1
MAFLHPCCQLWVTPGGFEMFVGGSGVVRGPGVGDDELKLATHVTYHGNTNGYITEQVLEQNKGINHSTFSALKSEGDLGSHHLSLVRGFQH